VIFPFLEAWITGDKREHHLLQRPRNAPTRTAVLAAFVTLYGLLWAAGGNDILARVFHLNLNDITYFMRGAVFVGPVIAFIIARRWCISLQRADQARLLHGYESGIIMRSPEGAYAEKHVPISVGTAYTLTARDRDEIAPQPEPVDENGVSNHQARLMRLRARLSRFWFEHDIQKPTAEELEEAHHHAEHELEAGPAAGAQADGHQLDGRRELTQG
jgi:ubiquinol-cytochrome c reductase cytochrome b subunit